MGSIVGIEIFDIIQGVILSVFLNQRKAAVNQMGINIVGGKRVVLDALICPDRTHRNNRIAGKFRCIDCLCVIALFGNILGVASVVGCTGIEGVQAFVFG